VSLYQAKFGGVTVFGALDQVFPKEDAPTGAPMLYLGEKWAGSADDNTWHYLKVLLPSGFVGWVFEQNVQEMT
jgi:hypothetical protein